MTEPISAQSQAKQYEILAHFQQAIRSLGYETRLFDAEEAQELFPGPLLLVGLEKDPLGRDRTMQFGFLPLPDSEDLDYVSLIQCYAPLPFVVEVEHRAAVERQLADVNRQTGVGYFGLTPDGKIYYRYVLASAKWSLLEAEMIQQLLLIFTHMQNQFSLMLEAAAQGQN